MRRKDLVKWIGWRNIHQMLMSLPKDSRETDIISSMIESLESEGLTGFMGFKEPELQGLPSFVKRYQTVVSKIPQLMEDIESYMLDKDPEIVPTKFWRDGRAQKSADVISFCDYAYSYRNWASAGYYATLPWVGKEGSFAMVSFQFDEGKLYVWGRVARETIRNVTTDSWKRILDGLSDFKAFLLTQKQEEENVIDVVDLSDKLDRSTEYVAVDIRKEFPFEMFLTREPNKTVKELADYLLNILLLFRRENAYSPKEKEGEEPEQEDLGHLIKEE